MATKKAPAKKPAKAVKAASPKLTNEQIKSAILVLLAEGESLRGICRSEGMPAISTVMKWVSEDGEFSEQYARAREAQADLIFEALDDVSEEAEMATNPVKVAGLRLKADNIKWKLARMSPRKYGDKVGVEHSGSVTLFDSEQAKRMAALLNG